MPPGSMSAELSFRRHDRCTQVGALIEAVRDATGAWGNGEASSGHRQDMGTKERSAMRSRFALDL
jgi:hypothetical protein